MKLVYAIFIADLPAMWGSFAKNGVRNYAPGLVLRAK